MCAFHLNTGICERCPLFAAPIRPYSAFNEISGPYFDETRQIKAAYRCAFAAFYGRMWLCGLWFQMHFTENMHLVSSGYNSFSCRYV